MKQCIDNLNVIKPFLKFDSEDDFYYLQILRYSKSFIQKLQECGSVKYEKD
jgi:hypothetical protein